MHRLTVPVAAKCWDIARGSIASRRRVLAHIRHSLGKTESRRQYSRITVRDKRAGERIPRRSSANRSETRAHAFR